MSKFARLDPDGYPRAFYDSDIHGNNVPRDAVPILDAQWAECVSNSGARLLVDDGQGGLELETIQKRRGIQTTAADRLASKLADPVFSELIDIIVEGSTPSRAEVEARLLSALEV